MAERARALAAALLLALAGCAARAPHPEAFSFAVVGDTPYGEAEERHFLAMVERIGAEPLAFVIHVGDFTGGGACSDELFARRRAQLDAFSAPLVYTPGDNEWTDCRGADPQERLARLRQLFFAERSSLGRVRMPMSVQEECVRASAGGCECPAHPENRFWTRGGVRFVTLNVPGRGLGTSPDREDASSERCRDAANAAWLERAVRASERSETRALVVAIQANPFEGAKRGYAALVAQLESASRRIGRPVLLVHGDTHTQRVDTPFRDRFGHALHGLTRLETFGSPFVGWVRVDVDPDDPEVFSFTPRLHAVVPR